MDVERQRLVARLVRLGQTVAIVRLGVAVVELDGGRV
jgi:hypothetical protein